MSGNYKIDVIMETKKACPDIRILKGVAEKTLESEGIKNSVSLNLLFVDNKQMRDLNRKFLNRNEPTDVISFGAKKGRGIKKSLKGFTPLDSKHLTGFIGEVAVSAQMAEYNARRFGATFKEEIFLYIIHGILHLLGYDDGAKKDRRGMEERQNKILGAVCGSL